MPGVDAMKRCDQARRECFGTKKSMSAAQSTAAHDRLRIAACAGVGSTREPLAWTLPIVNDPLSVRAIALGFRWLLAEVQMPGRHVLCRSSFTEAWLDLGLMVASDFTTQSTTPRDRSS
jgi:hypothetical protein